jgi:hypothetical protein
MQAAMAAAAWLQTAYKQSLAENRSINSQRPL